MQSRVELSDEQRQDLFEFQRRLKTAAASAISATSITSQSAQKSSQQQQQAPASTQIVPTIVSSSQQSINKPSSQLVPLTSPSSSAAESGGLASYQKKQGNRFPTASSSILSASSSKKAFNDVITSHPATTTITRPGTATATATTGSYFSSSKKSSSIPYPVLQSPSFTSSTQQQYRSLNSQQQHEQQQQSQSQQQQPKHLNLHDNSMTESAQTPYNPPDEFEYLKRVSSYNEQTTSAIKASMSTKTANLSQTLNSAGAADTNRGGNNGNGNFGETGGTIETPPPESVLNRTSSSFITEKGSRIQVKSIRDFQTEAIALAAEQAATQSSGTLHHPKCIEKVYAGIRRSSLNSVSSLPNSNHTNTSTFAKNNQTLTATPQQQQQQQQQQQHKITTAVSTTNLNYGSNNIESISQNRVAAAVQHLQNPNQQISNLPFGQPGKNTLLKQFEVPNVTSPLIKGKHLLFAQYASANPSNSSSSNLARILQQSNENSNNNNNTNTNTKINGSSGSIYTNQSVSNNIHHQYLLHNEKQKFSTLQAAAAAPTVPFVSPKQERSQQQEHYINESYKQQFQQHHKLNFMPLPIKLPNNFMQSQSYSNLTKERAYSQRTDRIESISQEQNQSPSENHINSPQLTAALNNVKNEYRKNFYSRHIDSVVSEKLKKHVRNDSQNDSVSQNGNSPNANHASLEKSAAASQSTNTRSIQRLVVPTFADESRQIKPSNRNDMVSEAERIIASAVSKNQNNEDVKYLLSLILKHVEACPSFAELVINSAVNPTPASNHQHHQHLNKNNHQNYY